MDLNVTTEGQPTWSYFVESGQAARARDALDAVGVSYTESPWQPGIRQFLVDASDPEKLDLVFEGTSAVCFEIVEE